MMLTDLADVLRAAGLPVVEIAGWKTRGHAPMTDVRTIVCHHTAGLDDRQVIIAGRPGLPGPLAHFWLSRTGVWHVIAAGLCYHAGESRDPSYTNSHSIGVEAEALGTGVAGDWPDVQMDAYVAGVRALADHYKVPYSRVLGHKETCAPLGRKSDPNFNMTTFRTRVENHTEDDMPEPRDLWAYEYQGRQALSYLVNAEARAKNAEALAAQALAITKAVAAKTLTAAEITAAAKAGTADALDDVITGAKVEIQVQQ